MKTKEKRILCTQRKKAKKDSGGKKREENHFKTFVSTDT